MWLVGTWVMLLISPVGTEPAGATLVPGGPTGKRGASDCYATLEVADLGDSSVTLDKNGSPTVTCEDGETCDQDGTLDGTCDFLARPCTNKRGLESCSPPERLRELRAKAKVKGVKGSIPLTVPGLEGSACGSFVHVEVPLGESAKPSRGNVKMHAKAPKGTVPRVDKDSVRLACTTPAPPLCPENPAGGPSLLRLTVAESGHDLDLGWTGIDHNFSVPPNGTLELCLSGCDFETDTQCTVEGLARPSFGAPTPLLASNIPSCIVSRFDDTASGSADFATGDITLDASAVWDVYFTDRSEVCPRCVNGRCSSGENEGNGCTIDATVLVAEGIGDKTYALSEDCPPLGNPVGSIAIDFQPLTSGTSATLTGPIPCERPPGTPPGVPADADDCGSSECGTECTGNACATRLPDPLNPSELVCGDNKGGIAQNCCAGDTTRPCFPIADGGSITRTGRPGVPMPALPDTTFPKAGQGVLAAIFCLSATGNDGVNSTAGYPGPGAMLLTTNQSWLRNE